MNYNYNISAQKISAEALSNELNDSFIHIWIGMTDNRKATRCRITAESDSSYAKTGGKIRYSNIVGTPILCSKQTYLALTENTPSVQTWIRIADESSFSNNANGTTLKINIFQKSTCF